MEAYCLVCQCLLSTEELAATHLHEPAHTRNLDAVGYYDKYKHDCIRKVKDGYFCGMCNMLLTTAASVGLHVAEASHIDNRGALLLSRSGGSTGGTGGVLAHGNILLQDDAWHGLVEETCVICNTEFAAKDAHKSEPTHILNLVQSKVLFGSERRVYRKIDENLYQCLTCNKIFLAASFNDHFNSANHKTTHQHIIATPENTSNNGTDQKAIDTNDKSIDHKQNGDIKTCIRTKNSKRAPKESVSATEVKVVDPDDIYCKVVGAENYIMRVGTRDSPYCILCHTAVGPIEFAAEHLNSKHHKIMLKLHREHLEKASKGPSKTKDDTEHPTITKKHTTDVSKNKNGTEGRTITQKHTTDVSKTKNDTKIPTVTKKDTTDLSQTKNDTEEPILTKQDTDNVPKIKKGTKETAKTKKDIKIKPNTEKQPDHEENDSNNADKSQIFNSVSRFQNNEVDINLINDTAYCKKCKMNIDFNYNTINKHIAGHTKTSVKKEEKKIPFDHGAEANGGNINLVTKPVFKMQNEESISTASIEDIKAVAKKHGMMYNGRELHCTACDTTLPVNLKNIEEHLSGNKHKAKMTQPVAKPKKTIAKQSILKYAKNVTVLDVEDNRYVIINEKVSLTYFNFLFLSVSLAGVVCIACNVKISSIEELQRHIDETRHVDVLKDYPVITSLDSEFVREMKPDTYHCGFCNDVATSWERLEEHLVSSDHKRCRTHAEWRLREHLSVIRDQKVRKQMEFETFARTFVANALKASAFTHHMFNNRNFDSDSD